MQIEQYIQSGIVEAYATGNATDEQAREFENLLPDHPALKQALEQVLTRLQQVQLPLNKELHWHETRYSTGVDAITTIDYAEEEERSYRSGGEEFVSASVSSPTIRVHKYWRGVFIAVFFLSKLFLGLFIYYFVQYQAAVKEVKRLEVEAATNLKSSNNKNHAN